MPAQAGERGDLVRAMPREARQQREAGGAGGPARHEPELADRLRERDVGEHDAEREPGQRELPAHAPRAPGGQAAEDVRRGERAEPGRGGRRDGAERREHERVEREQDDGRAAQPRRARAPLEAGRGHGGREAEHGEGGERGRVGLRRRSRSGTIQSSSW